MVRPQWQFLLAGGTTDQYLAKISSADGDYEWRSPSGGGSPGGSDTQIQFNNAGVFAGSANLVWSAFDGMLSAQTTGGGGTNYAFEARLSNGQPCLRVGQTATNASFVSFGDVYQNGNVTYFQLGDAGKTIDFSAPGGLIQLGDPAYIVNGSLVAIDDLNQKTTSNVKHEASNASGTFFDTGAGTFDVGDTAAIANLTTINLDDANNRIVLSANRPVIGNAANSGKVYMWNGSTSTYWYLAIGTAGAIITGDTGSASIP